MKEKMSEVKKKLIIKISIIMLASFTFGNIVGFLISYPKLMEEQRLKEAATINTRK